MAFHQLFGIVFMGQKKNDNFQQFVELQYYEEKKSLRVYLWAYPNIL